MKSHYYSHGLMLFIFSGLCFLLNGGEVDSTRETVYNTRESQNRMPFRRIVNCKSSESAEHLPVSKDSPSTTPSLLNILFEEDYNSTRSRLYRSGLTGAIRKNHLGQPIVRRQWRRNRKNNNNKIK
nr:uncharacterized protein LOC108085837 [Drosophila kikkawai]